MIYIFLERTVCKNKSPYCDDWAVKLNDCHVPVVATTCPVSCNIDGCGKFQPCKDHYTACPSWAKRGCHKSMQRWCPKSCGVCGGEILHHEHPIYFLGYDVIYSN